MAAASVAVANRLPRRLGRVRYGIGFWLKLAAYPAATIQLTAGKRTYEGPAINVVLANGSSSAEMNIAPRATVMDGRLDIQVFKGPRRRAFTVMPRVTRGPPPRQCCQAIRVSNFRAVLPGSMARRSGRRDAGAAR